MGIQLGDGEESSLLEGIGMIIPSEFSIDAKFQVFSFCESRNGFKNHDK